MKLLDIMTGNLASKSLIVHKNVKDYELLKDHILVTINVGLAR